MNEGRRGGCNDNYVLGKMMMAGGELILSDFSLLTAREVQDEE